MKSKFVVISFIILTVILFWHNVSNEVTVEDKEYIEKILKECNIKGLKENRTYDEEIEFLQKLEDSLIYKYPFIGEVIPINNPREPKDLYYFKQGLCFDRSRVIEKICRNSGFKVRHVFLFLDDKKEKDFSVYFRKDSVNSHAVSEVKTKKGWLILGSNFPWIAMDKNNSPLSMRDIKLNNQKGIVPDSIYKNVSPLDMLYDPNIKYVYGLYSRHGRFYAPFNFIPDYNLGELFYNLF